MAAPAGLAQGVEAKPLLFQGVGLFDGERVVENATVVVKDGKILAVNDGSGLPRDAQVVEGPATQLPRRHAHPPVSPSEGEKADAPASALSCTAFS